MRASGIVTAHLLLYSQILVAFSETGFPAATGIRLIGKKLCCQDRASFIYVTDGADVKTTVKKLKAKKKYYVRVRTYKTVKINGKSIRIYSGWSKAKTVTTKK